MSSLILCLCPQLIRLLLLCVLRHVRVILHAKFPGHLREEAMLPQHLREQGGTNSSLTDFVSKDEHRASLHGAHQRVPGDKTGRAGGGQLIRPPCPQRQYEVTNRSVVMCTGLSLFRSKKLWLL